MWRTRRSTMTSCARCWCTAPRPSPGPGCGGAIGALLWQLLAQAGADVEDPDMRAAALHALPTAAGTVSDLAALLR